MRYLDLRHREEELQADAAFRVICSEVGRPMVYRRGALLCVVNPGGEERETALPADIAGQLCGQVIFEIGSVRAEGGRLYAGPQSFAVIR